MNVFLYARMVTIEKMALENDRIEMSANSMIKLCSSLISHKDISPLEVSF